MAEEGRSSGEDGIAAAVYNEPTSLHFVVDGCFGEVRYSRKGI